jgi:DNA-binding NarL/FixJ family response regulator
VRNPIVIIVSLNRLFAETLGSALRHGPKVHSTSAVVPTCFNPSRDLLLVDWNLPDRKSRTWPEDARIVLFNMPASDRLMVEAMRNGVFSCVPRTCGFSDLCEALRCAEKGLRWLPESLLVREVYSQISSFKLRYGFELSPRQREVAVLRCARLPLKRIAALLKVSVRWTNYLLYCVEGKTGAAGPVELLAVLRKDPS